MDYDNMKGGDSIESPSVVYDILTKPITTAIGNPTIKENQTR